MVLGVLRSRHQSSLRPEGEKKSRLIREREEEKYKEDRGEPPHVFKGERRFVVVGESRVRADEKNSRCGLTNWGIGGHAKRTSQKKDSATRVHKSHHKRKRKGGQKS